MWIVRLALRRPYTFVVLALLLLIMGPLTIMRTPTDIFPNIGIPVVIAIGVVHIMVFIFSQNPIKKAEAARVLKYTGIGTALMLFSKVYSTYYPTIPTPWNIISAIAIIITFALVLVFQRTLDVVL